AGAARGARSLAGGHELRGDGDPDPRRRRPRREARRARRHRRVATARGRSVNSRWMTARALEARDGGSHDASCRSFDGMIARLGTPAISPEDEARVRAHLAICPGCDEVARLVHGTQTARPEAPVMLS